ncbi:MAG: response regulator [Candidatus Omnitrophica bacterium]|nr:response regulator [Candidatus Omnitrophota bacterium]
MKILIVDDSLMDRKLLCNALTKNGITNEVLQASNGEEGLKMLSTQYDEICLVLLDWQMPVVDGIQFMKGALADPETAKIPIVMITASGSEDNKRQAREVNPSLAGYIVKPYKIQMLVDTIKPYIK